MFGSVLVANRGEIAVRIIRTLRTMGISPVAVYSDADRFAPHVALADKAVRLGPAPAAESYLNADAVIAAARATGAGAVHPGYGFLSENAGFAEALEAAGVTFIGPRPAHIRAFGLKHTARALAQAAAVPLLPGTGLLADVDAAVTAAADLGYPVMLKSTAGGGGIGMSRCDDEATLRAAFATVERTARASFGDARVYLERFVARARHVEVQVFGNGRGRVVALGERDCSLQRRNQKVIEETPAPNLPELVRQRLCAAAEALCASIGYSSAGTVEFIYDPDRQDFAFLEVNTRLQVEHPVTEAVLGIDLVDWMVRQAAGEDPIPAILPTPQGHAIEARLYAEQPHAGFRPSAGRLTEVAFPNGIRVDGWITTGTMVETFYDPMLAKIIVHGRDRPAAISALRAALAASRVAGIATNLEYLAAIVGSAKFASGDVTTSALNGFAFAPKGVEVLSPGAQSSLQELPGRLGLWHVGVPPSGPMDARSHRAANRLLGNPPEAPALELTMTGPTLRFLTPTRVALAGARMRLTLDGSAVAGPVVDVPAGGVLSISTIEGPGQRAYLSVEGGFAAAQILGSRATFALGGFGGHATGTLRTGDVLAFGDAPVGPASAPEEVELRHDWTLGVVYGPHGAPDFFAPEDIDALFSATYEVHYNSDRTGVRLIGPAPKWARADGGEAGLHPSNLHDNAYAVGAIDFTGDMPILLGPDGPSLGGFVCPGVVAADDLWKLGQLRPGDEVRFAPASRPADPVSGPAYQRAGSPVVWQGGDRVSVAYRRQGDANLLVEYGQMTLDVALRLRVHLLMKAVAEAGLPVVDLTPGIRSLQIHYDPARITRPDLIGQLQRIETLLPDAGSIRVPSRIVHLPLSWNDPQAELAMRKYQDLVRPNAPWCPSNIEFIRRINGLKDEAEVQRTILDARYLVLGLGDVYLGAPVATPVDPRHRLVTTKYNPARTWTPENAVGIGGAYMCIYGMEGPGGYQLFGRTIQVWNTWSRTPAFKDRPWLLDFFDQIRFHLVSPQELAEARTAFPHGAYPLRIEETVFDWAAEEAAIAHGASGVAAAKGRQQAAFEAERVRWKEAGLDTFTPLEHPAAPQTDLPQGCTGVESPVPGSVWKFLAEPGARVSAGDTVAIIESMKMEIAVVAPVSGRLRSVNSSPGRTVRAGEILAVMESE